MIDLASDEMQLTIHYSDYYALPAKVRELVECYSSRMAQRTKYGLVFVIAKNRWPEIEAAMKDSEEK